MMSSSFVSVMLPVAAAASAPITDSTAMATGASPTSTRRAAKACANCRRNKIRCDGLKPCGACAKKGFRADQCTDGCDPCRRARVRCEDAHGKPCKRCLEMRLECKDEFSASLQHRFVTPPLPSTSTGEQRRGSERAKSACSGCRRDNKKCDDQRPCSRCIARNEECVHLARGPKLVKLRCEGCRDDNTKCEDSRPCTSCIKNSRTCVIVPRKGRGHGTRVRAACVGCRRDKVRCNGDRPCSTCLKKGSKCIDRVCEQCVQEGKTGQCRHYQRRKSHEVGGNSNRTEEIREESPQVNFQVLQQGISMENYDTQQRWTSYAGAPGQSPSTLTSSNDMMGSSAAQPVPESQLMFVPQIHRTDHQSYSTMNNLPYFVQEQNYYYIPPGGYPQGTPSGSRAQPHGTHNP